MDGINRDHPPFAQTGERRDNYITARGEGDGSVEFYRRTISFFSYPSRSQRGGKLAVGFAARGNVNLAIPGLQSGDRHMRGVAASEEAHPVTFLDARNP